MLDYENPHYCPAYKRVIDIDLCYDSLCCLTGQFKISSVQELAEIKDIEHAKEECRTCPWSDLSGGMDEWNGEP